MRAFEAFSRHIDMLFEQNPAAARKTVKEIKAACGISSAVYSNWRRGITPIRKLQRNEITQILNHDLFKDVID